MILDERIQAFAALGTYLQNLTPEEADRLHRLAHSRNSWFIPANVRFTLQAWADQLEKSKLSKWLATHGISENPTHIHNIGLVMQGQIPMEDFYDMLCVLLSGHRLYAKINQGDLLPKLLGEKLLEIEPRFGDSLFFPDQLKNLDAYLAAGNETSAANFRHYFRKTPHLVRNNFPSCAVLIGNETEAEFKGLGRDLLQHWGLGNRSVNKLFVPAGYNFSPLIEALEAWSDVQNHHKWSNHYDYHKSIYLINGAPHLDSGFLLFREDEAHLSPISVVFYQYYRNDNNLSQLLDPQKSPFSCIVGSHALATTAFGRAHRPNLEEHYPTQPDTLDFLKKL